MVLSVHIRGYLIGVPNVINKVFGLGAYGVALYFLISGFLGYSSVKKSAYLKDYAIKRAIRILPTYYFSLFLTFILDVFIIKDLPISPRWLYHIFFLNMFVPSSEWMWWNSVNFFWTMPSFIAWYILSPFIFHHLNNSIKIAVVTLISVMVVPILKKWMYTIASEQFVNWNFFSLLFVFFLGALAWFVINEKKQWIGIGYAVGLATLGWLVGNKSGFLAFGLFFYVLIVGMSLVKIQINSQKIQNGIKLLSNISYSVYLSHYFVLKALGSIWSQVHWAFAYIAFVVCAGVVGFGFYYLVEKPAAKWLQSKVENKSYKYVMNDD